MFFVGLTGGIATGKSTVAAIFREKGYPVIDADAISKDIVDNDRAVQRSILNAFGPSVFNDDGTCVDRALLGDIVFADQSKRKQLNAIVHPIVIRRIFVQVVRYFTSGHGFIIFDIPLLFESGSMIRLMSEIVVVCCSPEIQLNRLLTRNPNLSRESALARIRAQLPLEEKCARATVVIDNDADNCFGDLDAQVERCLRNFRQRAERRFRRFTLALIGLAVIGTAFMLRPLLN